jgi:hypothetical protein
VAGRLSGAASKTLNRLHEAHGFNPWASFMTATMPRMWSIADITDALAEGLSAHFRGLDEEHAVYGLDALPELAIHPIIASAFALAGFGVNQEQRYPSDRTKKRGSEGDRCDIVLTKNAKPLAAPDRPATLFDPIDAVDLSDAFWMEVKVIPQFTIDGPNNRYSAELMSPVRRDVVKLGRDKHIIHAGVLIVLFVASQHVAEHDLGVWQEKCLNMGVPIGSPSVRYVPMSDRHGNACCAIALYPINRMRCAP